MTDKYEAGDHNSVRPQFLEYSIQPSPVSLGEILYWKLKQQEMQKKHEQDGKIDLWESLC